MDVPPGSVWMPNGPANAADIDSGNEELSIGRAPARMGIQLVGAGARTVGNSVVQPGVDVRTKAAVNHPFHVQIYALAG